MCWPTSGAMADDHVSGRKALRRLAGPDAHRRLAGLDALRGIAALSILAFHLMPYLAGTWRGNAYLAVDFFFMLSGYVMARTYETRLAGELTPVAFMILRWKRLWPAMFVGGLIGLPWFLITIGEDHLLVALANLLLIPTFALNRLYPLDGPAWSIFFELLANLLHALLLRRLSTPALVLLATGMAVILAIAGSRLTLDVGGASPTFLLGVPRVLLSYAIGMILWRTWRDRPTLGVSPVFAFLLMPIFFGAATQLDGDSWISGMVFILVGCPLMLAGGLRWTGRSKWAGMAGALSFPLYAFHAPIFATVSLAGIPIGWGIAASLIAAWLFTRLSADLKARSGGVALAGRRSARST